MSSTEQRTLSPKLRALLRASKRCTPEKVLNIQEVRVTLSDLYHSKMSVKDVVCHMFLALQEISQEPRFEALRSPEWPVNFILAPLDKGWFHDKPGDKFYMVEFYERIVAEAWSVLRLSRVDWCHDLLWPETPPALKGQDGH